MFVEGEILDFLPVPARAVQGIRPSGQTKTALIRIVKLVLTCVPLIGLIAYAIISMGLFEKGFPIALPILQNDSWTARNGEMLRVAEPIHNLFVLVKLIGSLIAFFLPLLGNSQPASYWQVRSLLTDLGIVCVIWLLERYRKTHIWAEVMLNIIPKTFAMRQYFNAIWQLFPITVPLVEAPFRLVETCASLPTQRRPQQEDEAKRYSTKRLHRISHMDLSLALVYGSTFVHTRVAIFLKYDATITMTSGLVWLGMKSSELKDLVSWWKVIGRFAQTTAILGSGEMALSWAWREEIMPKIEKTQSHSKEV
ncbi:hypothetical protein BDV37DRAFT_284271 [Aspergillus pseudonomiae]|uniref:Uncharacterized protein n=1 Tax=Aspergillus pseudonomiae TaxID=1506151 RepID=A0A5N7D9N2_9EURO|nr:uncharacterized protein BDV37DRAFT_284271 [Aspergillus pseudonomiae]KAE8402944.1 hypothetical protein BDV37DRAFT_284271 [Aspergillus pseudonomiae]